MGKSILLLLIITIASLQTFSQIVANDVARREQERIIEQRRTEAEERRIKQRASEQQTVFAEWNRLETMKARRNSTYRPLSQIELKELEELRKKLEPDPKDFAQYDSFLKQPKTGLFRLMPNQDCVGKYVVKADENCEKSAVIGEYYSFALDDYASSESFDLTYKDGELFSRGILSQTILTSLGDIPLENLSPASKGVKYLSDFIPQTENKAVKKQFAELFTGLNFDGYRYSKSSTALLNNTYALRVIAYRIEDKVYFRFWRNDPTTLDQKIISSGGAQKRSDIIIAFRIIRQDADNSLSILWKELTRKKAPKITFKKNEPLSGIEEGK